MDDDAGNQAMMEMMGFSSFGGQQNKKRKYNLTADAALSKDSSASNQPPSSSGSNSLPLGTRKPPTLPVANALNSNEIDLEDDENDVVPGDSEKNNTVASHSTQVPLLPSPSAAAGLPARPADPQGHQTSGAHGAPREHGSSRDDGKPWFDGYYDHGSNQNPWRKLEEWKKLKPRDDWPVLIQTPQQTT